jgi:hypothetical protein
VSQISPYPERDAIVPIGIGLLLCLVTCGIYYLVWQYKQMQILNAFLGRNEFSFFLWVVLTILTFGLFGIYYEYKMAKGINDVQQMLGQRVNHDLALISVFLFVVGVGVGSVAIQQTDINNFYGDNPDF